MTTDTESLDSAQSDRDKILAVLHSGIQALHAETQAANPSSREEKYLQLRRHHEIGYLANQYRKLKTDTDVEEFDERLELLEQETHL